MMVEVAASSALATAAAAVVASVVVLVVANSKNYGKWSKNRNIIEETYFLRVLCMPAHQLIPPESSGCPHMAPKGSRIAGNSKNYEKWSKNRYLIEITHFCGVLACPAHHLTLPKSSECPQTTPKVFCTAGKSKNCEKWSKNRNLIEITHFCGVLGMSEHHPTLPGSYKWVLHQNYVAMKGKWWKWVVMWQLLHPCYVLVTYHIPVTLSLDGSRWKGKGG